MSGAEVREESHVLRDTAGHVAEYVCVEYPGHVVNVDKMLDTLGGIDTVSHMYSDANRRLELRFRPSDSYCKPACSTRSCATGLLVRVTRTVKKKKKQRSEASHTSRHEGLSAAGGTDVSGPAGSKTSPAGGSTADELCVVEESYKSTLLGAVRTSYSFNTLCDFQYLPLVPVQEIQSTTPAGDDAASGVSVSKITKVDVSPDKSLHEIRGTGARKSSKSNTTANKKSPVPKELVTSEVSESTACEASSRSLPEANSDTSSCRSLTVDLNAVSITSNLSQNENVDASDSGVAQSTLQSGASGSDAGSGYAYPYDCFVPQDLVSLEWLHEKPQFLFLPPPTFTRMDNPQAFFFRGDESEGTTRPASLSGAKPSSSTASTSCTKTTASSSDTIQETADAETPAADPSNSSGAPAGSLITSDVGNVQAHNVIYRTRQRRTLPGIFCDFETPTPTEPLPEALMQFNTKFRQRSISPVFEKLKQLFEERPIWSRAGVRCALGYSSDNIKYLLPCVGYYFMAGPWRNLWVKFGYDPRQNPQSFLFQTFNYRLKQTGLIKSFIEAKRSYSSYLLPYKSSAASKKKVPVIQSNFLSNSSSNAKNICNNVSNSDFLMPLEPGSRESRASCSAEDSGLADAVPEGDDEDISVADTDGAESSFGYLEEDPDADNSAGGGDVLREDCYKYKPGWIPPCRQMFYQYIDVVVPEIQEVLERNVLKTSQRLRCDARYGWLSRDVEAECRAIMGRLIDTAVRQRTEQERSRRPQSSSSDV
ncbi:uncharacterized protein LOC108681288 [Hyalella azteca]|uniref:Uncharacterized protein LOC108681288 n=1 Tax=Hyalella azteca TaxID=294128 RepID=A0A8B7PK92_HYAAZ|nr:uncharacterized protein LOC108681288 [Hyalella azteca]